MKRPRKPRDPCRPEAPDMKAARAWMAERGITQPRGLERGIKVDELVNVTVEPVSLSRAVPISKLRIV